MEAVIDEEQRERLTLTNREADRYALGLMAIVKRPRREDRSEGAPSKTPSMDSRVPLNGQYISSQSRAREHFCYSGRLDYSCARVRDDPGSAYFSFDTLTKVVHAAGQSHIAPAVVQSGPAYVHEHTPTAYSITRRHRLIK